MKFHGDASSDLTAEFLARVPAGTRAHRDLHTSVTLLPITRAGSSTEWHTEQCRLAQSNEPTDHPVGVTVPLVTVLTEGSLCDDCRDDMTKDFDELVRLLMRLDIELGEYGPHTVSPHEVLIKELRAYDGLEVFVSDLERQCSDTRELLEALRPAASDILALSGLCGAATSTWPAALVHYDPLEAVTGLPDELLRAGVSEAALEMLQGFAGGRLRSFPRPDLLVEMLDGFVEDSDLVLVCTVNDPGYAWLTSALTNRSPMVRFALASLLTGDPNVAVMTRAASKAFDPERSGIDVLDLPEPLSDEVFETFLVLRRTTTNERALTIARDLEE